MDLLILGGTVFLGRHLAELALKRGHSVTLFNRGSHSDVLTKVEQLHGDRDGDLEVLKGKKWDAVIDTSGYVPRIVRKSAKRLAQLTDHYTFISSISVYEDFSKRDLDEEADRGTLRDENIEEVSDEKYGPLKSLCETVVQEEFPRSSLVVRPGLIVGPYDPTDRFSYWPWRIKKGGDVLAPGNPEASIQWIDVRDLASWILNLAEKKRVGVYHATGPSERLSMRQFLEICKDTMNPTARIKWVSEEFLMNQGVAYWSEMPLWIPKEANMDGFLAVNNRKAIQAGLTFRPIRETIRDTAEWLETRATHYKWKAGMDAPHEKRLMTLYGNKNE